MSGSSKTAEDFEARPLLKGEIAHAKRMAKDPDMQPELKTMAPVYGKNAKVSNALPFDKVNPVVQADEDAKKGTSNKPATAAAAAPAEGADEGEDYNAPANSKDAAPEAAPAKSKEAAPAAPAEE